MKDQRNRNDREDDGNTPAQQTRGKEGMKRGDKPGGGAQRQDPPKHPGQRQNPPAGGSPQEERNPPGSKQLIDGDDAPRSAKR